MESNEIIQNILPPLVFGLACAIIVCSMIALIIGVVQYRSKGRSHKEIYQALTRNYNIRRLSAKGICEDKELCEILQKITHHLRGINECDADTQKKQDIKRCVQNYYVPTIHRFLEIYSDNQKPRDGDFQDNNNAYNISQVKKGLSEIAQALEKAESICLEAQTYDIEAEMKVLHQKIQMDGLGTPDF